MLTRNRAEDAPVSVIVLTYRSFGRVYDTLASIAAQDYPNMELLISDDASDEFPRPELEGWLDRSGLRERMGARILCRETNTGIVAHTNLAARDAKGAYIKFLSPGDGFRSPRALSSLVALARESGAPIVTSPSVLCRGSFDAELYQFPRARTVRALQKMPPAALFDALARANAVSAIGTLYSCAFFEAGGLDEGYRYLDDWPNWLAYVRAGNRLPCLSEAVTCYGVGDGVSSAYRSAFQSPALRADLIRCYEREILPYRERLSPLTARVAEYRWRELRREPGAPAPLQDLPLELYFGARERLKGAAAALLSRRG